MALSECYINVALWDEVHTLLHAVIVLKEMLDPEICDKPSTEWPEHYIQAISEFSRCIIEVSLILRTKIRDTVSRSPPLRHLWEENEPSGLRRRDAPSLVPRQANAKDQFPALVAVLTARNIHRVYPLHQITEHIERLLETDTSLGRMLTRTVGIFLADIQILEEVMRQLRLYCPELYGSGRTYTRPDVHKSSFALLRDNRMATFNAVSSHQLYQSAPQNGQFH